MTLQAFELPLGKPQSRRKTPKFAPLVALTVLLTIPLYYPSIKESHRKLSEAWHSYESLEDSVTPNIDLDPPPKENNQDCSLEVDTPRRNPIEGGAAVEPTITKRDDVDVEATLKFNEDESEAKNLPEQNRITKETSNFNEDESDAKNLPEENQETNPAPPPSSAKANMAAHREKMGRKRPDKGRRKKSKGSTQTYLTPPKVSEEKLKRSSSNNNNDRSMVRSEVLDYENCDLFSGEWVPNPEGPYYTNMTCNAIQEHQNCMRFGRPDEGFLKWKWKPDGCELPIFDPDKFLELVRGKSIAFVGDSVARNHMQSLICLLTRVVYPVDLSDSTDQNKRYEYIDYNFNLSMFWSPYLVKTEKTIPNDVTRPFKLFLDEFDEHWTSKIQDFDYVIISAGHWFFRPTYFYLNRRLVGCLYCPEDNVSHLMTSYFSYRWAFRTAFRAINDANNPKGITFLRTFAPSHFEGGPWDKGGDCARTRPFKRNETVLEDYSLEMYMIQLEELRIAQKAGRRNGLKIRLFDATKPMLLRPDGHPSKYGHWPVPNVTLISDCVHWCLPGPIDSWNDFLQELMKREIQNNR